MRWYVVGVASCEPSPEVLVGLPCFCPFVTVAGRGCCRQRWLAAAGLLPFGLVDVAVNVTDVSVGSRRASHASMVCAAMGKEGRWLMPVGAVRLSSILVV